MGHLWMIDPRGAWHAACEAACRERGWGFDRKTDWLAGWREKGWGFVRPRAAPGELKLNRIAFHNMAAVMPMVQDAAQIDLYEDKSGQFRRWGRWMPPTWRFESRHAAIDFVNGRKDWPLVSKADVGASSVNVRILRGPREARRHVAEVFGRGLYVRHCDGGSVSRQQGYVLLQAFIPHTVTWRVNAIGRGRAVFKRYCYAHKPVAQTGNVEPVMAMDDEVESLLAFADEFFEEAGTRWCAIDVLKAADGWRLLESSLAWPWPSPGSCMSAPIFRTAWAWDGMWRAMLDEIEGGGFA